MPLLGFQERFAQAVENGVRQRIVDRFHARGGTGGATIPQPQKRQTIRAYRADGHDPQDGDTLYLWTGLRRPGARKLGEVICTSSRLIEIEKTGLVWLDGSDHYLTSVEERDAIARDDGFADFDEMFAWFEEAHGLPFKGFLIRW